MIVGVEVVTIGFIKAVFKIVVVVVFFLVGEPAFEFGIAGLLDGDDCHVENEVLAGKGVVSVDDNRIFPDFFDRVDAVGFVVAVQLHAEIE